MRKRFGRASALCSFLLAANLLDAAGNIILTGEDVDFHAAQPLSADPSSADARAALTAIVTVVRHGSTLPVLLLAQPGNTSVSPPRSFISQAFENIGIPACPSLSPVQPTNCYVVFDPTSGPMPAFSVDFYSAVGVASARSGPNNGDNTQAASDLINKSANELIAFYQSGGGLFAFSSKGISSYYDYVPGISQAPEITVVPGYPPQVSAGANSATPTGLQVGLPTHSAVQGHNLFDQLPSETVWDVLETYTGADPSNPQVPVTDQPLTIAQLNLTVVVPTSFLGIVGVPFSGTLAAVSGFPPYTWTLSNQPSWLTVNNGILSGTPISGLLSGTPTTSGTFTFTATVTDSNDVITPATAQVTVVIAPLLTTPAAQPLAWTAGIPNSGTLVASGGTSPYVWSAVGQPSWLQVGADGTLSGTPPPAAIGTPLQFRATVTDSGTPSPQTSSATVSVTVSSPYVPPDITLTIQPSGPQPTLTLLATNDSASPYSAVLTITPPSTTEIPGPVFAGSSVRTLCFVIPGNTSGPVTLPDSGQFSEGSVAGILTISLTELSLGGACGSNQQTSQGGSNVTFALPQPVVVMQTQARSVPIVDTVTLTGSASSGITVTVLGSSNTQELVSATFIFTTSTGSQLNRAVQVVPLGPASSTWFPASTYGGVFEITQTFPFSGSAKAFPNAVTVILINSVGASTGVTNSP